MRVLRISEIMSIAAKFGVIAVIVTSLLVGTAIYSSMYIGLGDHSGTSAVPKSTTITTSSTHFSVISTSSSNYYTRSTSETQSQTGYAVSSSSYTSTSSSPSVSPTTTSSSSSSSSSSITTILTSSSMGAIGEVTLSGTATYEEQGGQCGGGHTPTGVTFLQLSNNANYSASFTPNQDGTSGNYSVTIPNNESYAIHITWTSVCGATTYSGACTVGTLSLQSASVKVQYNVECFQGTVSTSTITITG